MDQGSAHGGSQVILSTLPTELLVYIISFLSLLNDRVKLRYVSRWLKCVIEETPSLWRCFVWPHYDSQKECCVKEILKACGRHIKLLSFRNTMSPTLVEMLQYCSNVQHLSLPSTKLDLEQLRNTIHYMRCLLTLELEVDDINIRQVLSHTNHLKEITAISDCWPLHCGELFKYWKQQEFRPPTFNVITPISNNKITCMIDYATQQTTICTKNLAYINLFKHRNRVALNASPTLPYIQLIVTAGQITIPCVKLSHFGILGLEHNLAVMNNCQDSERTMCEVRLNVAMSFIAISAWLTVHQQRNHSHAVLSTITSGAVLVWTAI